MAQYFLPLSQNCVMEKSNKDSRSDDKNKQHKKKHNSALAAAAIGRSATAQVDPHSNSGLANTGTNISYEGPTAPAAGGSVGTGYASGKEATGGKISANSDYDQNRATHVDKDAERTAGTDIDAKGENAPAEAKNAPAAYPGPDKKTLNKDEEDDKPERDII